MTAAARVQLRLRVAEAAKAEMQELALRESERSGVSWDASKLAREWMRLGRDAWFKAREVKL